MHRKGDESARGDTARALRLTDMWKPPPGAPSLRSQVLAEFAACATVERALRVAAKAGEPRVVRLVVIPRRERGPRRIVA